MLGVALVALLAQTLFSTLVQAADGESWALLVAVIALIVGVVTLAVGNLRYPEYGLLPIFSTPRAPANNADDQPTAADAVPATEQQIEWRETLLAVRRGNPAG